MVARSAGNSDGSWHGFGSSRAASLGVASTFNGGFRSGFGFRGGCCFRPGFGFGFGWGFGGWGFGYGYPFWAFGWNPWWYNPYWYSPYWYAPYAYGYYPGYDTYQDYGEDWSNNPPPYRPGSWPNHDQDPGNLSASGSANSSDDTPNDITNYDNAPVQPEATPDSAAPSSNSPTASPTSLVGVTGGNQASLTVRQQ